MHKFFAFFVISAFLISCEKKDIILSDINSMPNSNECNIDNFSITDTEIINYINLTSPKTKASEIKISPIIYQSDTVLYEVKYDNSYRIFSSDKRLPVIIAYSDNSSEIDINQNPAFKDWIEHEAKSIAYLKNHLSDTIRNRNTRTWERIETKYRQFKTKAEGDPDEEDGYWRWVSTDTINISVENTNHLISYPWHQKSPYNSCVPFQFNSTERCAAGCVAVAGAHIFNYTHNHLGIPETMVSSGSCSGWYLSDEVYDYSLSFNERTSGAWDLINANISSSVAALIGWIAKAVDMDYGAKSYASSDDFADLLDAEGVTNTFTNYSGMIAFNRVFTYNEPVYISSSLIEQDSTISGHAYIMDRAKLVTYTTESLYEYVPHMNGGISTGETKYETEELCDRYISFRFGWYLSELVYDEIYVNIYRDWEFSGISIPNEGRRMLYNFQRKVQ